MENEITINGEVYIKKSGVAEGNTGDCNTGYWNTGNLNTGNWNTGYWNTGNRNTGDWNTGNWNTGDCNTGYWNTGNRNTGDCNTGYCNTGNWNTGYRNTGYCNTITPEECLIFNKPAKISDWANANIPDWMYFSITEFVDASEMSDEEKEKNPSYETTGGYLKVKDYKESAFESWNKASKEDKELTLKLPNFDREVFKEIFGFYPDIE